MATLIARIRGLSPLGPIFGKELRTTARRKRTYILRVVYLAALLLPLILFSLESGSRYGGVAARAQRNAELGAEFFNVFSMFTWFAMALVGPVLTSTAINSERLHKTLPILLMTPITAWQIVSGKLFSRLWIALTLIGLTLPMLAVVRLLGGVEIEQITGVLAICIATVLMTASIGLFLSTLMNRAYAVILLSYGFLFCLWVLLPIIVGLFIEAVGFSRIAWFGFLETLAPIILPVFAVGWLAFGGPGTVLWHWCVLFHLGFAAILLVLSALLVRRMARREHEGQGGGRPAAVPPPPMPTPPFSPGPIDVAIPVAAAPRQPLPRLGEQTISNNPVLWRELRRPLLARTWQRYAATFTVVGMMLLLYILLAASGSLDESGVHMTFAFIFCGLLMLLTSVIAATSIAHEKESDTWTLLLATPLSGRQVVLGKLAGLLRRVMWPSLLIVAHFLLFTIGGVIVPATLAVILLMILGTNFLWLATGMYLSLRIRATTFAVILNLLAPIVLYAVVPILMAIGGALAHDREVSQAGGIHVPYVYIAMAGKYLHPDLRYQYQLHHGRPYLNHHVWMPVFGDVTVPQFVLAAGIVALIHILAGVLLILYMIRRFDRIIGRAPQVGAATIQRE